MKSWDEIDKRVLLENGKIVKARLTATNWKWLGNGQQEITLEDGQIGIVFSDWNESDLPEQVKSINSLTEWLNAELTPEEKKKAEEMIDQFEKFWGYNQRQH